MGNKYIKDQADLYKEHSKTVTPIMYVGVVTTIDDPKDAGRIKVHITGVDKLDSNNKAFTEKIGHGGGEMYEAFPLLPKMIGLYPKVGEAVFVFTENLEHTVIRYWIGPIISQLQNLNNDGFSDNALAATKHTGSSAKGLGRGLKNNDAYPQKEHFSLQGRDNADIIFKPSELLLRAGKFTEDNKLSYNDKTQAYLQIKDDVDIQLFEMITEDQRVSETDHFGGYLKGKITKVVKGTKKGSVTTLVSNKINLISHDGMDRFDTLTEGERDQDKVLQKILEEAHPLVFGDKLVELLFLIKEHSLNHSHNINAQPFDQYKAYQDLLNFNISSILSKNIKIN